MLAIMAGHVYEVVESPIGQLLLVGDGESVSGLRFGGDASAAPRSTRAPGAFAEARAQLAEYFAGTRRQFDLLLRPTGSAFQRLAWRALTEIPYGTTRSYGEQAARIGRPRAARAVGAANGRNPIPIIVPCHRLVGHDGGLTGFGGGLERKRYLLAHEATVTYRSLQTD
jgi:methylated-DNA-[protein]-cysteine S-methyltransferase